MSLNAKATGAPSVPAPKGIQKARCIGVVDMGTQHSERFGKDVHKVRITWELPEKTHVFKPEKGPEPFVISRWFTVSLHKQSALRPFLEAWRGRPFTETELNGFQLQKLIGVPAMLVIVHDVNDDGEVRANVNAAAPAEGVIPPQVLPSMYYEVEMGRNDTYKTLPPKLQQEIAKCNEWKSKESALPTNEELGVEQEEDPDAAGMEVSF